MKRKNEVLVGTVIIVGVLVAVFGSLWLRGVRMTRDTVIVDALFPDVGQLVDGAAVKFRGVPIGQVRSVAVEPDGAAVRVSMAVRRSVELPSDAGVILAPESMFGDWQAQIVSRADDPGLAFYQPPAPDALGGFTLPDISRLTATADEIAQNLQVITDRVEVAFTEETAQNLAQAITNIQDVSQRLADLVGVQADAFDDVVGDVGASAQEVGAAAAAARTTMERLDGILVETQVDSMFADAAAAASNLRSVSESMARSVDDLERVLAQADTTFGRLNRIGARLEAGQGSPGRLLMDSTFAMTAEAAMVELNLLLADVRANPRRYIRLSIF